MTYTAPDGVTYRYLSEVPIMGPLNQFGANGLCRPDDIPAGDTGAPTFYHSRDWQTGRCSCGMVDIPWPVEEYDSRPHGELQPLVDYLERDQGGD
jgi:hypothetical protein